jgi:predicted RNase H-like HicB family nuclease
VKKKTLPKRVKQSLSAVVRKEGKFYVAQGIEIDLASQGRTTDEALSNLTEAFSLWLKHADSSQRRVLRRQTEPVLTRIEA